VIDSSTASDGLPSYISTVQPLELLCASRMNSIALPLAQLPCAISSLMIAVRSGDALNWLAVSVAAQLTELVVLERPEI